MTRSDGRRFFKKGFGGVVLQNATQASFSAGRILARRLGLPLTRKQALEIPYSFAAKLKAKGKPLDIAHTDALCGEVIDQAFDPKTATLTIQGGLFADRPEGRDALGFVDVGMDGLSLTTTEIFDADKVYDIYVERVALCPLGAREGTTIRQHDASAFKTKDYKLDAQSVPSSDAAQHTGGGGKQRLTIRRTYAMMNMARTEASGSAASGASDSCAWQLVDAKFDPPVDDQEPRLVMSTKTEASAGGSPPPAPVPAPSAGAPAPSPSPAAPSGAPAPSPSPATSSGAPPPPAMPSGDAAMPPAAPLVPVVPAQPVVHADAEIAHSPYVRAMKAELEQQKAELQRLRARANEERRVNHDDTTSRPAPMNTAPTPSPSAAPPSYPAPNALPTSHPASHAPAPAQNYGTGVGGGAPHARSEYEAPHPFGHYFASQHPYAHSPYHQPYHHVPYGQHYSPMPPPPPPPHHAPYPDLNPYAADVRGYPSRAPPGAYPSPYHHQPALPPLPPPPPQMPVIPQVPAPQVPSPAPRGSRKRDGTGAGINAGEGGYAPLAAATASASAGAGAGEGKTRDQLAAELQQEKTRSEALAKVGRESVQYNKAMASEFKKILMKIKASIPQAEFSKFTKDAKLLKTVASDLYTSSDKGARTLTAEEIHDAIRRARIGASDDQEDEDDNDEETTAKSRRYKKSATQASKNSDDLLTLAETLDVVDDAQLAKAKADYCQYSKWAVFKMGTMASKRFAAHVEEHGTYVPISVELSQMRTAFEKTGLAFPLVYGFGAHQMQDAGLGGMEF